MYICTNKKENIMAKKILRFSEEELKGVIRKSVNKILNESVKSDGIYDIDAKNIYPYLDKIWQILIDSYADKGGFLSYRNKEIMAKRASLFTVFLRNGDVTAVQVYNSSTAGGLKAVGGGCDKSSEYGKKDLEAIIARDAKDPELFHWAEVSGVIEHWFKKHEGYPIPNEEAIKLLPNVKSVVSLSDDSYHYDRLIGVNKERMTKCVFGFNDKDLYEKLNKEFCRGEFMSYEDFRKQVNNDDPSLKKESLDYNPYKNINDKEKWALGFMATLEEYHNDGFNELTPYMYKAFMDAYKTLSHGNQSIPAIKQGLKLAKYLYSEISVLTIHNF